MRIGLVGTVSVGKTTLVNELAKLPLFEGYHTSTERSKYLRDLGIPLNTDSTVRGQLIFIAERSSELLNENLLTDRTCWDVCAFTLSAKSIDVSEKDILVQAAMTLKDYYDIVCYVDPTGVDIEDNGVREVNPHYRNEINNKIVDLLVAYPPKKLIKLKGSNEERISTLLDALNK